MMANAKGREQRDNYIIMEKYGYFRPTPLERRTIKECFKKINITIYGNGYDLIDTKTKDYLNSGILDKHINDILLYELKTTWRKQIPEDFKGFGFGVTFNELKNYLQLGDKFKLIFLNGVTEKIQIQPFKTIEKWFYCSSHFFVIRSTDKIVNLGNLIK